MSRLGKKPIEIPKGVSVAISGRTVTISSGSKSLEMEHRPEIKVAWNEDEKSLAVSIDEAYGSSKEARAYWGMTRALLANMVEGVTKGYEKTLEVIGVGYSAEVRGRQMALKVGFANTILLDIPEGVEVTSEKGIVKVRGADKQMVGQFAAEMRSTRKPEPYNGKGIKYSTETVRRKQGKAFGA